MVYTIQAVRELSLLYLDTLTKHIEAVQRHHQWTIHSLLLAAAHSCSVSKYYNLSVRAPELLSMGQLIYQFVYRNYFPRSN